MKQMNLFDVALPEVWTVGILPKSDGIYKCRVKMNNGEIIFKELECKDNIFLFDGGKILAWK